MLIVGFPMRWLIFYFLMLIFFILEKLTSSVICYVATFVPILCGETYFAYVINYCYLEVLHGICGMPKNYIAIFLYPPQNEVLGGYTVFSLSVIP